MLDQDEIICHATGERRQNYLNQIRCILEQMDDTPCVKRTNVDRKPILEYPGKVNMRNPKFRRCPLKQHTEMPIITNIPVQELRPTSEYSKHVHENDSKLQYYAVGSSKYRNPHAAQSVMTGMASYEAAPTPTGLAQRKKSYELAGGHLIKGCDCAKHNGLQDDCRRTECFNNPSCRTDPPTCDPFSTYTIPRNVNIQEKFAEAIRDNPPKKKFYCCCDPDPRVAVDPRGLPQGFHPFPCRDH